MPDLEDLGCIAIGGLALLALLFMAGCVIVLIALAALLT
jgi:hypothetical protein